jgi:hypothetical protein
MISATCGTNAPQNRDRIEGQMTDGDVGQGRTRGAARRAAFRGDARPGAGAQRSRTIGICLLT